MAYFSALGGTGGTSATITVTYSEDFYGVTITATNGTTTLTKTATSSGTLTFDVSEGGTWVVSGTVEGATYSESVDVTFEYTAPPLVALPDGSTALPVNDIQMWLKCAAIRDKTTYTTLADVLGDTETLIALCADSNACDYMARSTNWASGVAADSTAMLIVGKYNYCANKLISNATWAEALAESDYWAYVYDMSVPKMTGNTAPSGEVSATNYYGTNWEPWRAFNGDYSSNGWQCAVNSQLGNTYIQYKFTTPVVIKAVSAAQVFLSGTPSYTKVLTYKLLASNDNFVSDTHELATNMVVDDFNDIKYFAVNNDTAYQYYRMVITDFSQTGGADIASGYGNKFQFYGRTDNANYIPLVPVMTDNTHPSGVASASSSYSNSYLPYMAFNGMSSNGWLPQSDTGQYIDYEFDTPTIVNRLGAGYFYSGSQSLQVTVKIQGANSGSFEDITDNLTFSAQNSFDFFNFSNDVAYKKYRILLISTTVSHFYNIGDGLKFQLYRKSTLPIIHSAVEDSIFYMDDGSPVALCGIPVGDTIDVDLEAYKGQTLTLVSTVAKDPTNLSNDFSMNVRITPNITEIYLMPIKYLYWWGNMSDNCEELSNANGWNYGDTYQSPTYNKNDVFVRGGSNIIQGIGSKYAINGTTYNHLKYIVKSNNYYGGAGVILGALSTKGGTTWTVNESPQSISSPTLETVDISSYASNFGLFWANDNANRYGALNAFWYE